LNFENIGGHYYDIVNHLSECLCVWLDKKKWQT